VGDGVVVKKGYNRRAGKHLAIRHNRVYKSEYLHLSKFAKGMRRGKTVKRGSVIGYVGKTGLATGPHLDFRFWKNRRVINHLKEPMPAGKALVNAELSVFNAHSQNQAAQLDAMVLHDTVNLAKK
jgi:murein DD-endopeptidase MepM/ murein hydrolase activator NlpD